MPSNREQFSPAHKKVLREKRNAIIDELEEEDYKNYEMAFIMNLSKQNVWNIKNNKNHYGKRKETRTKS